MNIKAADHCCEECAIGFSAYMPCNKPATQIIGWIGRTDEPIRMCDACADHNIRNRNGQKLRDYYSGAPTTIPADPRDSLTRDEVLTQWQAAKDQLASLKEIELDWRKYVVKRAFPNATEGTNTVELGNGYSLKANVKYNYKLLDNDKVRDCLDRIAKIGNKGTFIADRLVSWHPAFLLQEYRELELAETDEAKAMLKICHEMLEISTAAPSVSIVEPKKVKA